jgi:transposase
VLGATILAEVGEVSRFASVDKFASYCGGPIERSSGKKSRASVNSGGNRTMNYVVHMIAQVRLRTDERSKALVERKQREGKTLRAALRVLKTYIARELYRRLRAMHRDRAAHPITA